MRSALHPSEDGDAFGSASPEHFAAWRALLPKQGEMREAQGLPQNVSRLFRTDRLRSAIDPQISQFSGTAWPPPSNTRTSDH